MITKEYFLKEIKKLADLTGQRVMSTVADLLYDELKETHYKDFIQAVNKLKYSDKRLTLGTLNDAIQEHFSKRREYERIEEHKQELINTQQFWNQNKQYINQGHCDRDCTPCKVKYCDIISKHSIQVMKDLLNQTKTLKQVNTEMESKFKGWNTGFTLEPF